MQWKKLTGGKRETRRRKKIEGWSFRSDLLWQIIPTTKERDRIKRKQNSGCSLSHSKWGQAPLEKCQRRVHMT